MGDSQKFLFQIYTLTRFKNVWAFMTGIQAPANVDTFWSQITNHTYTPRGEIAILSEYRA